MPEVARKPTHLSSIDSLRGIASILVCWYHITNFIPLDFGAILRASGAHGDIGVPIFFVISGFVLPYSLYRGKYTLSNFFRFVTKRIARLDPPYIAAIFLAVIVPYLTSRSGLHRGAVYHPNFLQILAHLGYANAFIGFPWIVGGFWSLAIEFQYYIVLALVFPILVVRRIEVVAGVYLAGGLAACLFPQNYGLPLFLIGIAGFRYFMLGASRLELFLCLAYAGTLVWFLHQPWYAASAVLTCTCILVVNYTNAILRFLGSISYSLYLTHQIFFSIPIFQSVRFFGDRMPVRVLSTFVSLAICILLAWCLYRLIEAPSQKLAARLSYHSSGRHKQTSVATT